MMSTDCPSSSQHCRLSIQTNKSIQNVITESHYKLIISNCSTSSLHTKSHSYVHTYIIHVQANKHTYSHTYVHAYTHTRTHTRTRTHARTRTHTQHTHKYTHMGIWSHHRSPYISGCMYNNTLHESLCNMTFTKVNSLCMCIIIQA